MRLLFALHDIAIHFCGQPYSIQTQFLSLTWTYDVLLVPARFLNQDLKIPRDVASPALAHKRKAARDPSIGCCWCLGCVVESSCDTFLIAFFGGSFQVCVCLFSFKLQIKLQASKLQLSVYDLASQAGPCTPDKKTKKGRLLETSATAPRISRAFTASLDGSPERHLANAGFPQKLVTTNGRFQAKHPASLHWTEIRTSQFGRQVCFFTKRVTVRVNATPAMA